MLNFREIREHPNYERLRKSEEFRCARGTAVVYGIVTAFSVLLAMVAASVGEDPNEFSFMPVLIFLVTFPCCLFYLIRMARIFSRIDGYVFRETVFSEPHGGFLRDTICFTVTLTDRHGKQVKADTNGIFQVRGTIGLSMENYVNQKVMVGYNEHTEMLVVIGKTNS